MRSVWTRDDSIAAAATLLLSLFVITATAYSPAKALGVWMGSNMVFWALRWAIRRDRG